MDALAAAEWAQVLRHVPYADACALRLASSRLGARIDAALAAWSAEALRAASLVTVVSAQGRTLTCVATPTPTGYVLTLPGSRGPCAVALPRRLLAHRFPALVAAAWSADGAGWGGDVRAESFVAYEPHVARTLPLAPGPSLAGVPLSLAADTRFATCGPAGLLEHWLQMHARFFVGLRVGPPRRRRGLRSRRWTKVART